MKNKFSANKTNVKLLAIAAIFILAVSSMMIRSLIQIKKDQLNNLLLKESSTIENAILERFNTTFFLIEKMGKEIATKPDSKTHILSVLEKYKSDPSLNQAFSWTIFSWSDRNFLLTVDGEYGIMKNFVSLANRDYVKESITKPWTRLLGSPVYGSTSNKWMIPGGIGIADKNSKTLGTLTIGFEIEGLAKIIKNSIKDQNVNVTLLYNNKLPIFSIDKSSIDLYSKGKNQTEYSKDNNTLSVTRNLQSYPYSIVLTYDKRAISLILWQVIYSRIVEIMIAISLSCFLLFLIYKNEKNKRQEIADLMQQEIFLNDSKSEFMRQLGHELKNFAVAISGLSNLAKEDLQEISHSSTSKTKEAIDGLDHINDISNELKIFITDLIDLNQVENGEFEIQESSEATNFKDLIERSLRILKSKIKNKNINIVFNCDEDLNKIANLDQHRIKQILISLISNAVKFSSQNSKIEIDARNIDQKKIAITIKDFGIGMTEEEMTKYLSKTDSKNNKSNSIELKLPITKLLIEKQGGNFAITSAKNSGTKVEITF